MSVANEENAVKMDDLRSLNTLEDIKFAVRRIDELEAKLAEVVAAGVRVRNYYENHKNSDVYAVSDFNKATAKMKGQNDE